MGRAGECLVEVDCMSCIVNSGGGRIHRTIDGGIIIGKNISVSSCRFSISRGRRGYIIISGSIVDRIVGSR